ncbi:MAG: SDR family NAD(P)-dependent oxidoreductase [Gemmatimonadota bacterium]|nr:SDR family NAD(P)-dependent oxidoreductase [Gemmatimonadota bacterium]MDH3422754.1 SDR family NAD(P)-dependent oxidoreductase [Gemmatimonadota bacterium]
MNRLVGKRVLITGASSGIGAACARHFAERGSDLLLSARRIDRLRDLTSELAKEHGIDARAHQLDVTDRDAVFSYVDGLVEEHLFPDILVNNAGKGRGLDKLQDGSTRDWDEMIDTNLKGLLYVTRAVLPVMLARDSGHVIHIGSIAGRWVYPKNAVYNATKFAVRALSEAMNIDLLGTKIRVSSVDPGLTETEFSEVRFDGDTQRAATVYAETVPLAADDVADAVIYVANAPPHVDIFNLVLMPTAQRYPGFMDRAGD